MWAWGEYLLLAVVDSLLNGEGIMANGTASANRTSTSPVRPVGRWGGTQKCQGPGEGHIPVCELGARGDDPGCAYYPIGVESQSSNTH